MSSPKSTAVAARYGHDGYGFNYIDSGSGSDWKTRSVGLEFLFESPAPEGYELRMEASGAISIQVKMTEETVLIYPDSQIKEIRFLHRYLSDTLDMINNP